MSGIVIETLAMAEAVPEGSRRLRDGNVGYWLGTEVGDTLTHIAVPVDVAQAMRAEMLAEAQFVRGLAHISWSTSRGMVKRLQMWVEHLFPAAIFDPPPPAPEPPAEVDPWERLDAAIKALDAAWAGVGFGALRSAAHDAEAKP